MPPALEAYDRALHAEPAPSVRMAQRLLAAVEADIASGRFTRAQAHDTIRALYAYYSDQGREIECDAVADVLDCFEGWSPTAAAI
jgi:hypothetical protein